MRDLLYQINEHSKTVTFTIVRDSEDSSDAIVNDNTITLSFEDIIKQTEELKLFFHRYEDSASKLAELIPKAEKPFKNEVDELKSISIYNTNLFAYYYSNILCNNAFNERKIVNNSIFHLITFRSIVNKSKSNIYSFVNCIKDTMFADWSFENQDEKKHLCIEYNKPIRCLWVGNRFKEYIVADTALFNFFFDFKKALYKNQDEDIINCSSDDNDFYESDTSYAVSGKLSDESNHCKQIEGQTFWLITRKRKKRAKNDPCKNPVKTIQVYFRSKMHKLHIQFPNNNEPEKEFKKNKKDFYKKIKDKVEEYKIEKQSTICPEMEKLLDEIENDINKEYTNIKLKYKKMN